MSWRIRRPAFRSWWHCRTGSEPVRILGTKLFERRIGTSSPRVECVPRDQDLLDSVRGPPRRYRAVIATSVCAPWQRPPPVVLPCPLGSPLTLRPGGLFPTNTFAAANYWADVVFQPQLVTRSFWVAARGALEASKARTILAKYPASGQQRNGSMPLRVLAKATEMERSSSRVLWAS